MAFTGFKSKLGSDQCNEYFGSIVSRNSFEEEDNTVLSILRFLMNEQRVGTFTASAAVKNKMQTQITEKEIRLADDAKLTANYFGGVHGPFQQMIIGMQMVFIPNKNATEQIAEIQKFDKDYKKLGYDRIEDIAMYIDRSKNVLVYQNETKQATIVFAPSSKKIQVMQMVASCLPRIFPWAFKDFALNENETAVLKLISEQKYKELGAALDKFYDSFDFYGKKLTSMLTGFCNQNFIRAITDQENAVSQAERYMDDRDRQLREAEKKVEDEKMKLLILRNRACTSGEDEKELIEFLKSNKNFTVLAKDRSTLSIGVNCYLNDYNEDIFKEYVEKQDRTSSYIYESSPYGLDLTKKLFLAIWKERRFNLRVYCEWVLHDDCTVEARRDSDMHGCRELMEDRIPQPHIDRYRCFNGYQKMLNGLAQTRDYIGILSTIQTSSSYINWTDSTVVSTMMEWLFGAKKNVKCLEDKDGNRFSVTEVAEMLKNEQEKPVA
jgi:hypothetical protein|nr:MAG TPA: hypothetical protein [Caudoviricetes sp.]